MDKGFQFRYTPAPGVLELELILWSDEVCIAISRLSLVPIRRQGDRNKITEEACGWENRAPRTRELKARHWKKGGYRPEMREQ